MIVTENYWMNKISKQQSLSSLQYEANLQTKYDDRHRLDSFRPYICPLNVCFLIFLKFIQMKEPVYQNRIRNAQE